MPRYAVAFASLFTNNIRIEIVTAKDEREALTKHSEMSEYEIESGLDAEGIKQLAFDCDALVSAELIP